RKEPCTGLPVSLSPHRLAGFVVIVHYGHRGTLPRIRGRGLPSSSSVERSSASTGKTATVKMLAFALLLGIAAPLAGAAAAPPAWTVVPDQSRITFSGEANGSPFEGRFEDWSASIAFDPKDLAQSSATVTID